MDELQLPADLLRELDDLEPEPGHRRRQLRELRAERKTQSFPVRRRVTERHRSPPRSPADQLRRQGQLPHGPLAALRPGEKPVEESTQRPPERQLVRDRLGKLERVRELGRHLPRTDLPALFASRQAPGAPAVRPQSFGDGVAR